MAIEWLYLLAKAFKMIVYSMESSAMLVVCESRKRPVYCIFMPPGIMSEWHKYVARYKPSTASSSFSTKIYEHDNYITIMRIERNLQLQ